MVNSVPVKVCNMANYCKEFSVSKSKDRICLAYVALGGNLLIATEEVLRNPANGSNSVRETKQTERQNRRDERL